MATVRQTYGETGSREEEVLHALLLCMPMFKHKIFYLQGISASWPALESAPGDAT
jgi:hypothetical protein